MKYLLRGAMAVFLLVGLHASSLAQGGRHQGSGGRLSQLENAKIAYLTDKISLTQDQAQRFWPIYNEFSDKRRDVARRMRQLRTENPDGLSDQQIKDNLTQALALRQTEVNLEKEYFDKFQKVLTIRQVGKLFLAERDFTKEVLKRVADRRGGPAPGAGQYAGPPEDK
ncbi:Spy/CpxP family protein refolding chaperone [Hymenobacter cellulosivorans]|uniref:Periplasmic heavy metal sensor n=1 Tax=Hymenobacter cellulosivorans TaxID=2932249 RepID=A0ABY4F693_9BACT|nr:periplasmic heavy metal sensor [Hymenobacter cellulosivorans]UOQ52192.1 periplasmic heavy metal sensor [Hymenobacter cellulosivorans]